MLKSSRRAHHLADNPGDERRIDASAQKLPEWHIADHVTLDSGRHQLAQPSGAPEIDAQP
jgi:hypothetical protein